MEKRYEEFSSLIVSINRHFQKIKNHEMSSLGLKGNHVQCLYHLYKSENGLTFGKLCGACDEDKGAMSRCIRELEGRGYLFIEESDKRRYKNAIKLTESGRKVGNFILEKISEIFLIGSEGISEENREIFYKSLRQIAKNLKEISENYKEER